jgi:3-methyladenine DNA glycosylase/8-oxoguanine DNA glycosylase
VSGARPLRVPVGDVDLATTLGALAVLPGDPTVRLRPGRFERATATPEGPGAIAVTWGDEPGLARVEAAGDGARWLLERAPGLLGVHDDPRGFEPRPGPLRQLWKRHRHDRIARTETLWHDLAWYVVQQRVSRVDAAAQWQRLVAALGAPAPGGAGLTAPPAPAAVARLTYHDLHRFGLERQRADNLLSAARAAPRLQQLLALDAEVARPALRSVRGVGPWTASCLATTTWGDADTAVVGDDGIPSLVAWVLAREERADDARMLELLAEHRPHRYRVVRLAFLSGLRPPRRHPRAPRHDVRRR